uniref:Uncharacterized protein n=1 Tax=Caenorhabditis japonica TaxID=281687 RepID=A0A8R1EEX6_CAEJA
MFDIWDENEESDDDIEYDYMDTDDIEEPETIREEAENSDNEEDDFRSID